MAQVESQPAAELALQPSPVLLEACLKVEQVVSRLQSLQSTISGIQLSPVNPKHTRSCRPNATTRALSSKDCASSKENIGSTQSRDEYRRKSLKYQDADSKSVQPDQSLKSKDWKQWSSPANQVHDVISEILMASEFAKQIATLVAEALQDGPQKRQEPAADQIQEPKKKISKDGKRRDIAFPSKAQVQKTMSAKALPSKPVNKFKVAFPSDSAVKPGPPVKSSRQKDPPSKGKCGPGSPHKRRISRANWSNSSSPDSLSPQSPHLLGHSPELKQERQKLFSSPTGSFRESHDADDELAGPRRHSMNVTEIKGSMKPWKLTPTKGVLFSNPVYLESSPPKTSPAKPSPVRIVPTTGRRRSWLTHQFPKSQRRCSPEADKKLRSSASGNPLASISKATFKREGPTKPAPKVDQVVTGSSKRGQKTRKVAPPSRYVEMVPLDGPQDNSLVTMLDVLKVRSPSRLPMSRLDSNYGLTKKAAVTNKKEEIVEDLVQCRVSHSHTRATPDVENDANSKLFDAVNLSDKENTQLPSCAPNAAKFLRSMSSGHALNRTLSRKNSAVSLLQRAKGWMSSQVVRQGRVRELERFSEGSGFTSTRRYSLPGQLQAVTSSRRLSLPGHLQGLASALEV
ncbi:hypothetical protein KC19_7G058700 [Ceratodon purpureus]|uniref:Uncharacterized protein n=1 Tax=Ceratodon purpureus TaxID=3225 RepID=A0A8T0H544_CERPU|nr:hypothetical protein KC19_7G058700 [Ceratodon purpureus]